MKYKICKDLDYVEGYLRYGHAEVNVEADSEEEALAKAEEMFAERGAYSVVVDDYCVNDCGDFVGKAYISK